MRKVLGAIGEADETPPDFTSHIFRSNDFNISSMESEPGGVLDWLVARGILALAETDASDRRDPLVDRGPAWNELASLREWLATALGGR